MRKRYYVGKKEGKKILRNYCLMFGDILEFLEDEDIESVMEMLEWMRGDLEFVLRKCYLDRDVWHLVMVLKMVVVDFMNWINEGESLDIIVWNIERTIYHLQFRTRNW